MFFPSSFYIVTWISLPHGPLSSFSKALRVKLTELLDLYHSGSFSFIFQLDKKSLQAKEFMYSHIEAGNHCHFKEKENNSTKTSHIHTIHIICWSSRCLTNYELNQLKKKMMDV